MTFVTRVSPPSVDSSRLKGGRGDGEWVPRLICLPIWCQRINFQNFKVDESWWKLTNCNPKINLYPKGMRQRREYQMCPNGKKQVCVGRFWRLWSLWVCRMLSDFLVLWSFNRTWKLFPLQTVKHTTISKCLYHHSSLPKLWSSMLDAVVSSLSLELVRMIWHKGHVVLRVWIE